MTKSSERPKTSRKIVERGKPSRRDFLKKMAIALAGSAVAGSAGLRLWHLARPEQSKEKLGLQESLKFIENEIKKNQNLSNLDEYGLEKTLTFIHHAYNVFSIMMQSSASAQMLSDSTVVEKQAFFAELRHRLNPKISPEQFKAIGDPKTSVGKTYEQPDQSNTLGIAFNTDAYALNKESIDGLTFKPKIHSSVLGNLLDAALHEPFHYEAGFRKIEPPLIYKTTEMDVTYDKLLGLNISGTSPKPPFNTSLSNLFDEISIYLIHRKILQPAIQKFIPSYTYAAPTAEYTINAVEQVFIAIGYTTPEDILQLRRSERGGLDLVTKLGERLPDGTFGRKTVTDRGIVFLGRITQALSTDDRSKVQQLIALLSQQ